MADDEEEEIEVVQLTQEQLVEQKIRRRALRAKMRKEMDDAQGALLLPHFARQIRGLRKGPGHTENGEQRSARLHSAKGEHDEAGRR